MLANKLSLFDIGMQRIFMDRQLLVDTANERGRRKETLANKKPKPTGMESLQPSQRFDDLWSRACNAIGIDELSGGGSLKVSHLTDEGHRYTILLDVRNQFPSYHNSHDRVINFHFYLGDDDQYLPEASEAASRDNINADPENQEILDQLGKVENSMQHLDLLLSRNGIDAERFAYSEGQTFEQ